MNAWVDERIRKGYISWVQELNKTELVEQSTRLGDTASEEETIDELRTKLKNKARDIQARRAKEKLHKMDFKRDFKLGEDNWEIFTDQLEQYFIASDIESEEKKRAIFRTNLRSSK